jgi:dUTP pyrophosphatase
MRIKKRRDHKMNDNKKIRMWSEFGQTMFKKSTDDSGYDLRAAEDCVVHAGWTVLVKTGIHLDMTTVYFNEPYFQIEAQIRPRSGLALNSKIQILNSPGTIDKNYLGSCDVIFHNGGDTSFIINKGDRIAQLVFTVVFKPSEIELIDEETFRGVATDRMGNGYGSTGTK